MTIKEAPLSDRTRLPRLVGSSGNVESELIIELGAEGGTIALYGFRTQRGWSFTREVIDWTPELIGEKRIHNKSVAVETWQAALELLDQYPWPKLSPISSENQKPCFFAPRP